MTTPTKSARLAGQSAHARYCEYPHCDQADWQRNMTRLEDGTWLCRYHAARADFTPDARTEREP